MTVLFYNAALNQGFITPQMMMAWVGNERANILHRWRCYRRGVGKISGEKICGEVAEKGNIILKVGFLDLDPPTEKPYETNVERDGMGKVGLAEFRPRRLKLKVVRRFVELSLSLLLICAVTAHIDELLDGTIKLLS